MNDSNSDPKNCDDLASFTAGLAYDPSRLRRRTNIEFSLLNLSPTSAILDKFLGYNSALTAFFLALMCYGGLICLIPSIIFSKLMGWPSFVHRRRKAGRTDEGGSGENLSTTEVGSITAIKALVSRAQMNRQGSGGPDDLAPLMIDRLSILGENIPGSCLFTRVFLWLDRLNFYLTGRLFQDQISMIMKESTKFGVEAYIQVRTCWLDDCVETFIREHIQTDTGKARANVVILGAGFDTRCYRMNLFERGIARYEVDAPGTQDVKRRVLRDAGIDSSTTSFVSCDFETEDWLEQLKSAGFDSELPTFFVWEGVTMYITRNTVKSTIEKVALCGKKSMIGFDYLDRTWALSPFFVRMTERSGEPWLFGMTGREPEELIVECNGRDTASESRHQLKVLDHLKYRELIKRYLPKHYDGRPIGYLDDFGGLLLVGSR